MSTQWIVWIVISILASTLVLGLGIVRAGRRRKRWQAERAAALKMLSDMPTASSPDGPVSEPTAAMEWWPLRIRPRGGRGQVPDRSEPPLPDPGAPKRD